MTSSTAYLSEIDAPQVAVNDIGSEEDFLAAIDATIKYFNDGDIVEGTIVKVDRDEVLLDIGYKTEGVIPSRELSIKHDVDPHEVVAVGDHVEALVLLGEDERIDLFAERHLISGIDRLADRELVGGNDSLGLVADVNEDLVFVDPHDLAVDDVALVEGDHRRRVVGDDLAVDLQQEAVRALDRSSGGGRRRQCLGRRHGR